MNHKLYFIAIIADALKKQDQKKSIGQALQKIWELGQQEEYEWPFFQFKKFMFEIQKNIEIILVITYSNNKTGVWVPPSPRCLSVSYLIYYFVLWNDLRISPKGLGVDQGRRPARF